MFDKLFHGCFGGCGGCGSDKGLFLPLFLLLLDDCHCDDHYVDRRCHHKRRSYCRHRRRFY